MTHDLNIEIAVAIEDFLGVVVVGTGTAVEDRESALPEEAIQPPLPRVEQFPDLRLGEVFEAAARAHAGVNEFGDDDAAIH